MRKIQEVLRLSWLCGLSQRQIAVSCKIGLGTVCLYLRRARAAGLGWPLPEGLNEAELDHRLFPPPVSEPTAQRAVPIWAEVECDLKRKGVTLYLLWEEHRNKHPDGFGYSRFAELYREWRRVSDPRMHQVHKAGEKLFVDYAGLKMPVTDRKTGEMRPAHIFVATLGASSYTYAEATWTQASSDWIGSHVRAFTFFEGVPELVVPDNLKSGVLSPCRYDPDLNRTYLELARHYGVAILPARVRKPRDKAKVENAVQQVERRVLAPLRDRAFLSLGDLNDEIGVLVEELNNRSAPGLPASRSELFAKMEKAALRPLPAEPYRFAEWKKARVNIDYHVSVEDHWYSVPYAFLRQEVEVRLTATVVEFFHESDRIASHIRSNQKYAFSTLPEHMPPTHREWSEWNPERFVSWARKSGTATAAAIEEVLASRVHPEQAFRACLGILRLGEKHGSDRLEAACRRALAAQAVSYSTLKAILANHLEEALPETQPRTPPVKHANIRGPGYYHPN